MDYYGEQRLALRANLHTHSTLSDGQLTPEQVIASYAAEGYDAPEIADFLEKDRERVKVVAMFDTLEYLLPCVLVGIVDNLIDSVIQGSRQDGRMCAGQVEVVRVITTDERQEENLYRAFSDSGRQTDRQQIQLVIDQVLHSTGDAKFCKHLPSRFIEPCVLIPVALKVYQPRLDLVVPCLVQHVQPVKLLVDFPVSLTKAIRRKLLGIVAHPNGILADIVVGHVEVLRIRHQQVIQVMQPLRVGHVTRSDRPHCVVIPLTRLLHTLTKPVGCPPEPTEAYPPSRYAPSALPLAYTPERKTNTMQVCERGDKDRPTVHAEWGIEPPLSTIAPHSSLSR